MCEPLKMILCEERWFGAYDRCVPSVQSVKDQDADMEKINFEILGLENETSICHWQGRLQARDSGGLIYRVSNLNFHRATNKQTEKQTNK